MKSFTIMLVFLSTALSIMAQPDRSENRAMMKERMESMKIAHITRALELTPQESEKFWPVYNAYQAEMEAVRSMKTKEGKKLNKDEEVLESLSDKEVEAIMKDRFETEQKLLDIRKSYLEKFKAVLPVKKIARLYAAEKHFKKRILEEFKNRRAH